MYLKFTFSVICLQEGESHLQVPKLWMLSAEWLNTAANPNANVGNYREAKADVLGLQDDFCCEFLSSSGWR